MKIPKYKYGSTLYCGWPAIVIPGHTYISNNDFTVKIVC